MAESFSQALAGSLESLSQGRPSIARRVASCLGARRVQVCVDGETVWVVARDGRVLSRDVDAAPADVEVQTTRETLVGLVNGREGMLDAVLGGRLRLRGAAHDLVAFDAALMAYLDGAVRVTAMQTGWIAYQGGTDDGRS